MSVFPLFQYCLGSGKHQPANRRRISGRRFSPFGGREATTGNASAVRRLGKHTMTSIPSSYYIRFDSFLSRPRSSGWFCRLDLSNTTFTRTRRIKWKSGEAILTRPRYLCSISFAMPFSTRRPIIIIWKILEAAQPRDVTKNQTKKLSTLLSFYFHEVLQYLNTFT